MKYNPFSRLQPCNRMHKSVKIKDKKVFYWEKLQYLCADVIQDL